MNLADQCVRDLLAAIGAKSPVPGGGAVASLTAAIGAALGSMVVSYSLGKRSLAAHAELHAEAARTLGELQADAIELAAADARAYGHLNELWKLAEDDERRVREFPAAVRGAIEAPQKVMSKCLGLLHLFARLDDATNPMLRSDLAIAAILAEAAARSAAWNVRINLPLLSDLDEREAIELEVTRMLERAASLMERIEGACKA